MTTVVLALGANLGDPLPTLGRALTLLAAHDQWQLRAVSSVYVTDPVGGPPGQPDYLNAVAIADVPFTAQTLLGLFHVVEAACGRVRENRWEARTLDLDLISYGDLVMDGPGLTLPHPRAYERSFVVQPWLEIDPQATLPGLGPIAQLAAAQPDPGVRRSDDLVLSPAVGATR